jgi:transcriptional regulator with XRE-family HTH domain
MMAGTLRVERARRRWSQDDLADRMAVHKWTRATVSDLERGNRNITLEEIIDLALAFEVTVAYLLGPILMQEEVPA